MPGEQKSWLSLKKGQILIGKFMAGVLLPDLGDCVYEEK